MDDKEWVLNEIKRFAKQFDNKLDYELLTNKYYGFPFTIFTLEKYFEMPWREILRLAGVETKTVNKDTWMRGKMKPNRIGKKDIMRTKY